MKTTLLTLLSVLAVSTLAHAATPARVIGFDSSKRLAKAAVTEFLNQANDPKSVLGQQLKKLNDESVDGRNEFGTLPKPVTASDLQVTIETAEEITVPWHYAGKDKGFCVADGDSVSLLISLSTTTNVHYSSSFETIVFGVTASETMRAKILSTQVDLSCEDLLGFEPGADKEFGPIKSRIEISKIKKIELPALN